MNLYEKGQVASQIDVSDFLGEVSIIGMYGDMVQKMRIAMSR